MESTYLAPETVRQMTAAAAFMGCLDEAQRSVLSNGFELDGVRRDWSYLPQPERDGLALGSLAGGQRGLAHLFDPERYCLRVFGTPGADAWGWQLAGHHVSLNFTIAGQYLSPTPCMLGSVPASYGVLAPLADDEERGYAFVNSLTGEQRAAAVICHRPPPDFATRITPRMGTVELPDHVFEPEPGYRIDDAERALLSYVRDGPKGVRGADLDGQRLDRLLELVAGFARRLPAEVADAELRRVLAAGAENLAFAWAGGTARGERHYYHVQGPDLLIEHDVALGGGNHIHSVWRNPAGDFGDDLLAAHYRAEHHPAG
jgi:hypothetical protein